MSGITISRGGTVTYQVPQPGKKKKTAGPEAPPPKKGNNPNDSRYNTYAYAVAHGTKGMSKAQIKDVQRYLNVNFQTGIAIDGNPNNKYLKQALKTAAKVPISAELAGVGTGAKSATTNTKGSVADLQKLLNSKGAKLAVDGVLGPKTAAAAKKYGVPTAGYGSSGGGGGGRGGGGAGAVVSGKPQSPQQADDLIKSQYGTLAWALNVPELKGVLEQAAIQGLGPEQLQAALENTNWWKTTNSFARDWQKLQYEDPGSYNTALQATKDYVNSQAARLGITIDAATATDLSNKYQMFDWAHNPNQLSHAIADHFLYKPGTVLTGEAGVDEQFLKSTAASYGVDPGTSSYQAWMQKILGGDVQKEDYTQEMATLAKSQYPGLAEGIDKGFTVDQITGNLRGALEQTLEVPQDQINWVDPKWNKLINSKDPKTGQPYMPTISDALDMVRNDPTYGYQYTQGAKDAAYGMIQNLDKIFGRTA